MGKLPTVSDARLMVILSSASTAAIRINSTWKPRPSFHYFIITECLLIYHRYFDNLIGCIMNRESKDLCFTTALGFLFVLKEKYLAIEQRRPAASLTRDLTSYDFHLFNFHVETDIVFDWRTYIFFLFQKSMFLSVSHPHHQNCQEWQRVWHSTPRLTH